MLKKTLLKYKSLILLNIISAAAGVIMSLLVPVLTGKAIDNMMQVGSVNLTEISKIITLFLAIILSGSVLQWLQSICGNLISYRTVRDIRCLLFRKLNTVPLKTIDSTPHGDLISRMVNDADLISDGLIQGFAQIFTGVATILGTLIFMLSTNFNIGLVVVLLTPLSLFVAAFISKKTFSLFQQQNTIKGDLTSHINEYISNQKVVIAFSQQQNSINAFQQINNQLYSTGVKAQFFSSLVNPSTRFVNRVVYASVAITGALACINNSMSIGQLSCFLSYANQYTKPFNEITGVITEFQSALAAAKRIESFLTLPDEPSDALSPQLKLVDGSVSFNDVSFSYSTDRPLIQNLNLSVPDAAKIAIVGPTGCGKTTLINLLMRFYDVTDGSISLSNTPITSVTRRSLRQQFGMVLQDTWLFSGTIFDNIAYGNPSASQQQVEDAARAAHAHSFIKRLPNAYLTTLEEAGRNLSQGQRQLLCIARIMLTLPPMLILDEATSSIDTRTEIQIQNAFQKLMQGRTTFIVAHRLSTIREADCILVMRDGSIIEQGNHSQLLQKNGFYAQMLQSNNPSP